MTMINITSFRRLVYASFAVVSMIAGRADGIANAFIAYSDLECTEPMYTILSFGVVIDPIGNSTTLEPSVISPSMINYVVEEYNDNKCADPTGNTEILSTGYDGAFVQNEVGAGSWYLAECLADGSSISQNFAPDNDTCSGDVWSEFQTVVFETSLTSCSALEIEGLYYNIISCTTDSATLFGTPETLAPFTTVPVALGLTPAPSTNNDDGAMPTIITDTPTPVAIEETVAPTTGAPSRTTIETSNTVAPVTTTPHTFSPAAAEATVAPDNTGAPNTSRVEAASGATRAKNTGVAAGAVAAICGLGLVVGRMRQ